MLSSAARSRSSAAGGECGGQPAYRRGDVLVAREHSLRLDWSGTRTSPLPHLCVDEQSSGGATSSSPANTLCNSIGRGRGRPHSHTFVWTNGAVEGRRPRRPRTHCATRLVGDEDVPTPRVVVRGIAAFSATRLDWRTPRGPTRRESKVRLRRDTCRGRAESTRWTGPPFGGPARHP